MARGRSGRSSFDVLSKLALQLEAHPSSSSSFSSSCPARLYLVHLSFTATASLLHLLALKPLARSSDFDVITTTTTTTTTTQMHDNFDIAMRTVAGNSGIDRQSAITIHLSRVGVGSLFPLDRTKRRQAGDRVKLR